MIAPKTNLLAFILTLIELPIGSNDLSKRRREERREEREGGRRDGKRKSRREGESDDEKDDMGKNTYPLSPHSLPTKSPGEHVKHFGSRYWSIEQRIQLCWI